MQYHTKNNARARLRTAEFDVFPLYWGTVRDYVPGLGLYILVPGVIFIAPGVDLSQVDQARYTFFWPELAIPIELRAIIANAKPGSEVLVRIIFSREGYCTVDTLVNERGIIFEANTDSRNKGAPVAYVAYFWSGQQVGEKPRRIACFVTEDQVLQHEDIYPNEKGKVINAVRGWKAAKRFRLTAETFITQAAEEMQLRLDLISRLGALCLTLGQVNITNGSKCLQLELEGAIMDIPWQFFMDRRADWEYLIPLLAEEFASHALEVLLEA